MNYLSLFTGIGGFDLACDSAGMECAGQVEIDKNCLETLNYHWPNVPKFKDVRDVGSKTHERHSIGLICGGFPCQDLSTAGKRKGLVGERSGLWFEFARIIDELEPKWVVAENVPGLLSSLGGRDFATIISWLAKRGYGVAWRVFDAKYAGVPQRRRRVFLVGCLGNGNAAKILFESKGGGGDIEKGREEGKATAEDSRGSIAENCQCLAYGGNNTSGPIDVSAALNAKGGTGRSDFESETFVAYNIQNNDGGNHKRKDRPNGGMYVNETDTALAVGTTDLTAIAQTTPWDAQRNRIHDARGVSPTLSQSNDQGGQRTPLVSVWEMSHADDPVRQVTSTLRGFGHGWQGQHNDTNAVIVPTLQSRMGTGGNQVPMVGVRRLTPKECERLQGFPDNFSAVCNHSDSTRYRQLGNAVAVPVVFWIMDRIAKLDKETNL